MLSVPEPDRLQYVLTQPSGLYDGDGERLGYLRAGTRVSGSSRGLPRGWIALDDEEDAYMKLADLRPLAPPRPSPRRFSRLDSSPENSDSSSLKQRRKEKRTRRRWRRSRQRSC